MKKEKHIKSYTRKTKSGKTTIVKAHKAKYDAVEKAMEMAKKAGSGEEFLSKKKDKNEDLLKYGSPWYGLDSYYEELFGSENGVVMIANTAKHKQVMNEVAKCLSKKYSSVEELGDANLKEITKEYKKAAKKLHPTEKLWSDTSPAFWKAAVEDNKNSKNPKHKPPMDAVVEKKPTKKSDRVSPKVKASSDTQEGISKEDFKVWYHWDAAGDPKNKTALKVEKQLKEKMGDKEYKKYFNEATDSYSVRGHIKAFSSLDTVPKTTPKNEKATSKSEGDKTTKERDLKKIWEKADGDMSKVISISGKGSKQVPSASKMKKEATTTEKDVSGIIGGMPNKIITKVNSMDYEGMLKSLGIPKIDGRYPIVYNKETTIPIMRFILAAQEVGVPSSLLKKEKWGDNVDFTVKGKLKQSTIGDGIVNSDILFVQNDKDGWGYHVDSRTISRESMKGILAKFGKKN